MYIVEIFRKRRIFEPIFKTLWERISAELTYPQVVDEDQQQKLLFVGLIAYAAVYAAATAAEMSSSAAHYLARMQMRQYKFDKPTGKAVERLFSGTDDESEKAYAELLLDSMRQVIDSDDPEEGLVATLMRQIADAYQPVSI